MERRTIEHPVIGERITFVRTSDETDGELTELMVEQAPGGANPPHFHRSFTETFTPVEGPLGVRMGDARRILHPGETVTVERGTVHNLFNASDRAVRFTVEVRPGQPNLERFAQIAFGLARDGQVGAKGLPRKLSHLALLLELGDVHVPGPTFRVLSPVLRRIADRARRRGVEEDLIRLYCT